MDGFLKAARVFVNGARLTDAFTTKYVAASCDNTIRENVEADRAFLDLNTLIITVGLLPYLR